MFKTKKIDQDVGATKEARILLGSLDRRLSDPGGSVIRFWGFLLLVLIFYLFFFGVFEGQDAIYLRNWILIYLGYLLTLEFIRAKWSLFYDRSWFRLIRVFFNLGIITYLTIIASSARFLLAFGYLIPVFATIVYFNHKHWMKVLIVSISLIGLYLGGCLYAIQYPFNWWQYSFVAILIILLSSLFNSLYKTAKAASSRLTEIARSLHRTLDLHKLMNEALQYALEITQAQRGLVIIINPRNKAYIHHIAKNYTLREGYTIESVTKECRVLNRGQPFECPDIQKIYQNRHIYYKYFQEQPRSIIAEPLMNANGKVLGVLNIAHDNSNRFDPISKAQLRDFAYLVSSAIENCLVHREVKLREARGHEVSEKFASATHENEVACTLIEESSQQIPHADRYVLHRFFPQSEKLIPVAVLSPEQNLEKCTWNHLEAENNPATMKFGIGIAGHALELHDTILVNDVNHHPWYIPSDSAPSIQSLLVAPLFDPEEQTSYGTMSLQSEHPNTFTEEDEYTLTHIATQGSLALKKLRDFENWRQHGGVLRKIVDEIRGFNIQAKESELCHQIAQSACRLLGFKLARVRLLEEHTNQLITVAFWGLPDSEASKLIGDSLPLSAIEPFLKDTFQAGHSYLIPHDNPDWSKVVEQYFYIPQETMYKKSGWRGYDALLTPLYGQTGKMLGLLTLDVPIAGNRPSTETIEAIGAFANAAGWILELNRLQERLTDQKRRARDFIDSISKELAKGRDFQTIGEVVVQAGAKLINAEACSLHVVRGNQCTLTHSTYLAKTNYIGRGKPISDQPGSGLTAWVAARGEVLCFNNQNHKEHPAWAGEEDHLALLPSQKCESLLLAPVKDNAGNVIGVLTLENKKGITGLKGFDEEDIERVQDLANEFAKAQEAIGKYEAIHKWERDGLEDDLHDLINWYHSGVALWIDTINEWLNRGDIEKVKELMPNLLRHAYSTVNELKSIHSFALFQDMENATLRSLLEWISNLWIKRAPPKSDITSRIFIDCHPDLDLPAPLRSIVLRIISMAFSNAIFYSGILHDDSVQITISAQEKDGHITIAVADNGKGMDDNTPEGYGIARMRQLVERIRTIGDPDAKFDINNAPGKGTQVCLSLATS